jgi:hypothetical protein
MNLLKLLFRLAQVVKTPKEALALLLLAAGIITIAYALPSDMEIAERHL